MAVNTAAVAVRQRFGRELKRVRENTLRDGRRVQQIDVAKALGRSTYHRYSQIERGTSWPKDDEWRTICKFLNMDAVTRATLSTMRSEGMSIASAWWTEYQEEFPESLIEFIAYEDAAQRITTCGVLGLPALLQTEAYARAMTTGVAGFVLPPGHVDRSVELRRRRRGIFEKATPTPVEFIFSEGALRQQIGGREVMVYQLASLLDDVASRPVTLRVIPFTAPATAMHMQHLLEFPGDDEKPISVLDSQTGMTLQTRPREVRETRYYIEAMRNAALSPRESVSMIQTIQKELSSE